MADQLYAHGPYVAFMAFVVVLVAVLTAAALLEGLQQRRSRR